MTTLNLPAKTTVYFGESRKPLLFVIMRPSFILMLDKYGRLTIRKGACLRTVYQAQLWGRKPQGLTRWNGRLTTASLEALKAEAKMLEPYYTVNDLVRIAVDRYVCTELLNP